MSAWTISETTVFTTRSSSPSAMTRITGSVPVRPGDYFQAEFAHLGNVTVQLADRSPA